MSASSQVMWVMTSPIVSSTKPSASSLQRLQVGDDVLAILRIGNADDHLRPMDISGWIAEIFVELPLVPGDASGFEGGRIVVARRGSALASEYARKRWS